MADRLWPPRWGEEGVLVCVAVVAVGKHLPPTGKFRQCSRRSEACSAQDGSSQAKRRPFAFRRYLSVSHCRQRTLMLLAQPPSGARATCL